jgi:hypothetical protein
MTAEEPFAHGFAALAEGRWEQARSAFEATARYAGREARSLLTTYFAGGNLDELTGLFGQAGLRVTATVTHTGSARFPSADALVTTEVESTPLGERISAVVYDRIKRGAREVLAPFTADDGTLEAPSGCMSSPLGGKPFQAGRGHAAAEGFGKFPPRGESFPAPGRDS